MLACDELAGTELMVTSLVLESDPELIRHDLALLAARGPIAERVEAGGGRAASLGGTGGLPAAIWRLARLLRRGHYDVVNAYGLKASVITRVLARILQRRAVFVCGVRALHVTEVERLDSMKARIATAVERLLSPLVDVYDSNTGAALDLLASLGIPRERLVHIPNGLDLSRWAPAYGAGRDGSAPLILCTARFVDRKRQQDLLQALAALRNEGHRFRAVLAGAGPTLGKMRELTERLALGDVVELPGPLDTREVRALLDQAAVVCLPSAWEGMPGSLMEAMASGVAVVATDVSGTNELVVSGESGLLVPAYAPPRLADALATVLGDEQLRMRLAAGGRRRMEECFSLEVMVGAKQRLYRELAARGEAPASASGSGSR